MQLRRDALELCRPTNGRLAYSSSLKLLAVGTHGLFCVDIYAFAVRDQKFQFRDSIPRNHVMSQFGCMAFADHAMLLVTDSFHKAVHAWDVEEGKGHVGFVMGGLREERPCPEDDNEPCPMSVASAGAFVAVSLLLHTVTRSEPNVLIFDASGWVCLRSFCFGEPPDLHALRFSRDG